VSAGTNNHFEQVGKAGADSLFRDPARKSTTVGVTVYPVTIASLEQFGDLQTVGERLLATGGHMISLKKVIGGTGCCL